MITSKNTGPFTQFDQKYYDNLKKRSAKQAEEYRIEMTAPRKKAMDLGVLKNEEFVKLSAKQIKEKQVKLQQLHDQDIQRMKDRKVIDLGIVGATQELYKQSTNTVVLDGNLVEEDEPTSKTISDDIEKAQAGVPAIGKLTDAEANATPANPIDLANLPDEEASYQVEYDGQTFTVTEQQINECKSIVEEMKEADDEQVILHMKENKIAPFNI